MAFEQKFLVIQSHYLGIYYYTVYTRFKLCIKMKGLCASQPEKMALNLDDQSIESSLV